MEIEAVILTGGSSRRMGEDKSRLIVGGMTMAERVATAFDGVGIPVTVLGREPLDGRAFLEDIGEYEGPAKALSRFEPTADAVFVCSCDLPRFSASSVGSIAAALGTKEAVIPVVAGREQYLCAVYSASVFSEWKGLVETGSARSMRELVRVLDCEYLDEDALTAIGAVPGDLIGVNTQDELRSATEIDSE